MRKLSVDELDRLSVEAYRQAGKHPVVLLLDDVRSAHNVGSAFRTADAFRVEKLFLCGITGTPPHREITKTALGADESVAWEYAADAVQAAQALKTAGYRLIAVEQAEGSVPLQALEAAPGGKYCFLFGNEVFRRPRRVDCGLRCVPGNSPVRHQTFAQRVGKRRNCTLGSNS
jgi:tRNA G18 (ribose-2'-O)-methylase SpoU